MDYRNGQFTEAAKEAVDKHFQEKEKRFERTLAEDGRGVLKMSNPKDLIGSDKLPMHLWPPLATAYGTLGMLHGMLKYGRSNWRGAGVRFSIYYDATRRHLDALLEGEDIDPESGIPHEAHILANMAIILDARASGQLTDDRNYKGKFYRNAVDTVTEHVKKMKEQFHGRNPRHFTIADNPTPTQPGSLGEGRMENFQANAEDGAYQKFDRNADL